MMCIALKRTSLVWMFLLMIGGCAASHSGPSASNSMSVPRVPGWSSTVALAAMKPADSETTSVEPAPYRLGAGDDVGRSIFENYAESVRDDNGGIRRRD